MDKGDWASVPINVDPVESGVCTKYFSTMTALLTTVSAGGIQLPQNKTLNRGTRLPYRLFIIVIRAVRHDGIASGICAEHVPSAWIASETTASSTSSAYSYQALAFSKIKFTRTTLDTEAEDHLR